MKVLSLYTIKLMGMLTNSQQDSYLMEKTNKICGANNIPIRDAVFTSNTKSY